jgi:hypothetical protein
MIKNERINLCISAGPRGKDEEIMHQREILRIMGKESMQEEKLCK